ncbi:putative colanic acid biosysnthesis UDP-glucose lipid carrier transferase [Aquimarina amphilecti]|uniref:Putative colanic acid biosysnthesis UDP-glucose lipid carrier transferase n=1 Tax=Aquimarina amphilecti TaxID=1038014 RepID=A0A1H7JQW7_AQUAM|nr:undecaprenyl-phosphate glucose phosphotransferase [Aquimarina amphilecti]SEK77051.1 putative colanic acid biosysnthesis UDP-glucose lipid carrier transferase [Aquimarina amphilecti]
MNKGGYSKYIRPLLYGIDLLMVSFFAYFLLTKSFLDIAFIMLFWIVLSFLISVYAIYRFTKITKIISLFFRQTVLLALLVFTYYYITGIFVPKANIINFFLALLLVITTWRVFLFVFFQKYRIITGSNNVYVVIVGLNQSTKKLASFFDNSPEYGYKFRGFFDNRDSSNISGTIEESYSFILENNIDEVYCSTKELSNEQIKELTEFCERNLKVVKFVADDKELFSKNLELDYYNLTPILSLSKIPLDDPIKDLIKRTFDIVFSISVIVLLLSWLIPIIALLIKIESRGPVFFKQHRYGADFNLFLCYKFRSMTPNKESDKMQASKNDARVTRMGKFIRRTSLDELPQFFNVLYGEMSVVGPRPLLMSHTDDYKDKINKFMIRHNVKPGITGLAQISGYRGNIASDLDMLNRVRYDIFYVENWSLILDINIILQTVMNIFKGEDKAY